MRLCSGRPPTRRHGRGGRQLCGLCRNQDAEFVDKNLTKHSVPADARGPQGRLPGRRQVPAQDRRMRAQEDAGGPEGAAAGVRDARPRQGFRAARPGHGRDRREVEFHADLDGTGMRTNSWTESVRLVLDWSRFLGRKNKLLQATSRSRSHGAL